MVLRFILAPGLMTGLTPVTGSRPRTVDFGAVVTDSCAVSFAVSERVDSWLSSLAFGAFVVGLPRRRLMFNLLKDGLDIPDGPLEAAVVPPFDVAGVVDETDLVDPVPRNLLRVLEEGRSACTELELSFCTASSSTDACFCPGRFLLKPPPFEPFPPKRFRVRGVGSAGASVVVVLPLPLDLNLEKEIRHC